jgi:hypothetical protein
VLGPVGAAAGVAAGVAAEAVKTAVDKTREAAEWGADQAEHAAADAVEAHRRGEDDR